MKEIQYHCNISLSEKQQVFSQIIDIGAKIEIYKLIDELTKQGKGVIFVSPELEELIGLSNRIYVMFEREITDVVEDDISQSKIISSMYMGRLLKDYPQNLLLKIQG